FFFQAEDGIRDFHVTGVQTCALPICLNNLLENPQSDRRMALVLAYGGYAYTFMAEIMCEATINVGAEIYTPAELAQMAIERFQAAIPGAQAAGGRDGLERGDQGVPRAAGAA